MKARSRLKAQGGAMTMSDLARLAGVSDSTVSRALADNPVISPETRTRIQELARISGFAVNPAASTLRTRQSKVIAVAVPLVHGREQHLSDPFMMGIIAHLADALASRGYDLLLSKIETHVDGWIEHLVRTRRVAGVILVGQSLEHAAIQRAAQHGIPLAVWGAKIKQQAYPTVGSDNRGGGYLATRHLIEAGRRRIAFLGNTDVPEVDARFAGYERALSEAGLRRDPTLQANCGFTGRDALEATRRLLKEHLEFDAVVACSDVIAMSAMRALSEHGVKVPDDVGVVGFDDVDMAAYTIPPLTTIRQDVARGAILLVDKVIAAAAREPVDSIEMPAELVIRGSSQPA